MGSYVIWTYCIYYIWWGTWWFLVVNLCSSYLMIKFPSSNAKDHILFTLLTVSISLCATTKINNTLVNIFRVNMLSHSLSLSLFACTKRMSTILYHFFTCHSKLWKMIDFIDMKINYLEVFCSIFPFQPHSPSGMKFF